ncbi:MAG: insulinase family protein [Propionibacteriaceae bacterium]|jgi:predicted Zn-dependent peptidase|nr:insulinase family protein [Propionibacteriaceae bacterium]
MASRPAVKPPKPWQLPAPREAVLDTGLRVLVFDRPGQHIAAGGIAIDTPMNLEPGHLHGLSALTYSVMDDGTLGHPGTGFVEAVEDLGGSIGGAVNYAGAIGRMDVPAENAGKAFALADEALAEAQLADADVERRKAIRISDIEQTLAVPSARARLALREALIKPEYRAAHPRLGTAAQVEAIQPEDVRAFRDNYYRPAGAVLVVAGDFPEDPIAQLERLEKKFTRDPGAEIIHEAPEANPPACVLVDRPGSVQANVLYGSFGLDNADPRIADIWVACYAMGGAFLSRLNRVLREEKGFTYGAHMGNYPMRSGGLLTASASFRNDVAAEAIATMRGLVDISAAPFTQAEVDAAVHYAVGANPGEYQTAQQLVDAMCSLLSLGLDPGFPNRFQQALWEVTPESATSAFADLTREPSLIVVGDAAALEAPLRADGWNPTVIS